MHRAPRLIATDIDGTFLDHNHRVTKRNREVVARAVRQGTHFALATGRPFRWIAPVIEQLPIRPLCVASNGAVIYDSDKDSVVLAHELQPEVLEQVARAAQKALREHGGVALGAERAGAHSRVPVEDLYVVDPTYSDNAVFEGFGVEPATALVSQPCVKFMLRNPSLTAPQMYELISPHVDPELAHVTYSINEGLIEVAAPGITKASGVEWLANHYGVAQEEVITFGDMPNDVEMLRWAGLGVAVANAADAAKDAADEITDSHTQAGVAKVLERWF